MILESTFTPIFLVLELFLPKRALLVVKTIGVRTGGARGAAPPLNFFGQNVDDSGKSNREKTL